ncbi:MAG TPA: flagellar brake protein [Methylophilus sp.]|nr:flagellar brake protein [Methylophilus sp.]
MIDQSDLSDDERCTVHNHKEICQILSDLAKAKAVINLSFNQGRDQCLSRVIAVDGDRNAVYLDIGIDDGFNRRLVNSNHVIFSKNDGIRISWASPSVSEVQLKDGAALKIAVPKSLIRLQRREFFRLNTPVVNPVKCLIPYSNPENPDDDALIELTLVDISLGGIGTNIIGPIHPALTEGARFSGCKINLPGIGEVSPSLSVRNIKSIALRSGETKHRIGLQFIEQSGSDQKKIHQYVFNLEREALVIAKSR